jgi:1,4-dihydroxy-2-naphthoyl-CoA hydrolase
VSTEPPATAANPTPIDPAALVGLMPFAELLGVRIEAASATEVRALLDWAPEKCTAGGMLHGGALMALADSTGAVCAFLNLPAGASTTTITAATNFFRGVRHGAVLAVARPLHTGRSTIVVQTDLTDADGRRVAQVTQTQAVLAGR